MKKFRLITALTLALLLVLGTPLSAMAASWDVTDSQGVYDAFATDTDAEVVINMQNDINMDHYLTAGADQSYTINGNGHTISDVMLEGEGSVEINADVTGEDSWVALNANGDVAVTVNGDVTSDNLGLFADGSDVTINGDLEGGMSVYDAEITVNGDVTSEDSAGIYASESDVTVNGDVNAQYNGVTATDGSNVTIEGNVTSEESGGIYAYDSEVTVAGDITSLYDGVSAQDGATVTVEGNIDSDSTGVFGYGEDTTVNVTGDISGEYGGVYVGESASVTVEGDVSSNDSDGISAWGEGTSVNVTGDVTGTTGVSAHEGAEVTVTGDVTAQTREENGYAGAGVIASEGAAVTVNGDVTGADAAATEEELQDPDFGEWGGDGVDAYNATVTVNGNVTGGDGVGTAGNGGTGVYAEDGADVTVNGNVTGGDVVADPEVDAHSEEVIIDEEGNTETYYWNVSTGGEGVSVSNTSNVTVNGNVTGGNTNGDHGEGGHAIWVHNFENIEDGENGALNVSGTAAGGKGGAGGEGGAALYFNAYGGFLPSEDLDLEAILQKPAEELTEEDFNGISYLINYGLNEGLVSFEDLDAADETVMEQITEDMSEDDIMTLYYGVYQKLVAEKITDLDAVKINDFVDITVGTLSDENGPKLNSSAGQEAAEEYAKEIVDELAPTGDNPRTGDGFNGMFFVALMTLSLLGMVALLTQRKRFV